MYLLDWLINKIRFALSFNLELGDTRKARRAAGRRH
jgi:hypothetical protein